MSTPRWLELDGTHNVRDVGGLRAGTGRVRSGVLLRGDHLEDLTASGAAHLCDVVGLRAIVDLRSPLEEPVAGAWMDGRVIDRLHLPLIDMTRSVDGYRLPDGELDLVAIYRVTLDGAGSLLAQILRFVVSVERTPALVHCAAGKDRTGVLCALILDALGVRHDDVVADYEATNRAVNLEGIIEQASARISRRVGRPVKPEEVRPLASVNRDYLDVAWKMIEERSGSRANYRREVLGFTDEHAAALRAALLETG